MEKACRREVLFMIVLDANYILRYLLSDNESMFEEAKDVISNEHCLLLNEVVAEVVYVLHGVYKTPKDVINKTLTNFVLLENMTMHESKMFLIKALEFYETMNLDFVDCCLCALKEKYEVKSFDKKLIKCMNK
jgi:predicted nucleic-acid-binding protein